MAESKKQNRITAAEVNDKVETLRTAFGDKAVQVDNLARDVARLQVHKHQKGLGDHIGKITGRVTAAERMLGDVMTRLATIEGRAANEGLAERNMRDLEEITQKLALIDAVDEDMRELRGRVDNIEAEQAAQKVVLDDHTLQLGDHNNRLVTEKSARLSLTNRVFNLENPSVVMAGWAVAAFFIVGFIVGLILWLQPVIVTHDTADDGVTKTTTTWQVFHDFGSWGIGAAAGAIVAALIIMFAKNRTHYGTSTDTPSVPEAPVTVRQTVNTAPAGYPGATTAPTKVMSTAGAGSGAR